MACHVSYQDMGACRSPPSKRENGKRRQGERWPVGGGLISRPPGRSARRCCWSLPSLPDGSGGWRNGGMGGEDAPVGKGPRRTRPHPVARTKYIAPVEVH